MRPKIEVYKDKNFYRENNLNIRLKSTFRLSYDNSQSSYFYHKYGLIMTNELFMIPVSHQTGITTGQRGLLPAVFWQEDYRMII